MTRLYRFLDCLRTTFARPDFAWATALAVVLLLPGYPDLDSIWGTALWAAAVGFFAAGLVFRWRLWFAPTPPRPAARWDADLHGSSV